jgi:long-subunit fatty acid transport protein
MARVLDTEEIPREHNALTARARIPGSTTHAFGGALGIYYSPIYQLSFGVAVFSPVSYNFETDLHLDMPRSVSTLGSGLRALGIEDRIHSEVEVQNYLPLFIQAGVAYQPYGYYSAELFGRYVFTSMYPSVEVQIKDSPVAIMKDYSRPGKPLQDSYLVGLVNSFSLWQRWTLGLNTTYASNSVEDKYLSVSLADFDTFLVGPFVQYKWSENLKLGVEYAHSFLFERTASNTEEGNRNPKSLFRPVNADGSYRAAADRFGLMVKYAF